VCSIFRRAAGLFPIPEVALSRIIAPRFELELWPGADGDWYIAVDLLTPSIHRLLPIEGPYSAEYAAIRLRTLIPREIAETLLTLARAAVTTGRAVPIHHLTRPT
jgi:hypothetical protein